ncbi:MAG: DNA repair protein RecO [Clostridia bacterium]
MSEPVKLSGVVVKTAPYKDNDSMLTVLTKERGVVSISAKGIKSLKNKNSSALSPLCYSSFVVKDKGSVYSLTSADLEESFYSLREDVKALSYGVYFAQLAAFMTGKNTPAEEEVRLLLNTLYVLSKNHDRCNVLCAAFEMKLSELSGIAPMVEDCPCGNESTFFDFQEGECMCALHKSVHSKPISKNAKIVMNYILEADLKGALTFDTPKDIATEVSSLMEEFISLQFGTLPKSLDYVKKLVY